MTEPRRRLDAADVDVALIAPGSFRAQVGDSFIDTEDG